jgi:hypothetical protein
MAQATAVLTPPIAKPPVITPRTEPIPAATAPTMPSFFTHVKEDPWLLPKLALMALVAAPQTYAICVTAGSERAGVMLGIVPDMLATIIVAWGMLGCLLFLEGYLEKIEGKHA